MPFKALGLALAVVVGLQAVSLAQEAPTPSTATAPATGGGFDTSPKTIRGVVQSVSTATSKLTLKPESSPLMEITVSPTTPIYSPQQKRISLDQLSVGDKVRIRYHPLTVEAMEVWKLK